MIPLHCGCWGYTAIIHTPSFATARSQMARNPGFKTSEGYVEAYLSSKEETELVLAFSENAMLMQAFHISGHLDGGEKPPKK